MEQTDPLMLLMIDQKHQGDPDFKVKLFCTLLGFGGLLIQSVCSEGLSEGSWPLGLEPEFRIPPGNRITSLKVQLGKRLFFDKRLSRNQTLSCATCHDPKRGFSNGEPVATGDAGQQGSRNVPTIINRLFGTSQFWDGRTVSLETQALGPIFNPLEMGMDEPLLLQRISEDAEYRRLFREAFDSEPNSNGVAHALACFERTLLCGSSPFDRYEWEGDETALTAEAKRGLGLFRGKARCSTCHVGPNFTDEKFHNLGAGTGVGLADPGRMGVTNDPNDHGKFRTPTLRNLASTAPYMHDGSLKTLSEVVAFYNQGGRANPNLDKEIRPLDLSDREAEDLVAFLHSLTGPVISVSAQQLDELGR